MVKFGKYCRMIRYSDSRQNEILGSDGWYIPDQRLSNANMLQNAIDKIRNQKAAFLAQAAIGENRYINPKAEFVTLMHGTKYSNAVPMQLSQRIFPEQLLLEHEKAAIYSPVKGCGGSMIKAVQPQNGEYFELEELYDLLKCTSIEVVELPKFQLFQQDLILILDEEASVNGHQILNLTLSQKLYAYYDKLGINNVFNTALICRPELFR